MLICFDTTVMLTVAVLETYFVYFVGIFLLVHSFNVSKFVVSENLERLSQFFIYFKIIY